MAEGPDLIGKAWAEKLGFPVKEFYPNWKTHGSYAGHLRNEDMGNYADALVAFWDGRSTGTRHMIEYMKKLGKPHRVIVGFRQPFI